MYDNTHYKIIRVVKAGLCGLSSSIQNTVDGLSTTKCGCSCSAVFQQSKRVCRAWVGDGLEDAAERFTPTVLFTEFFVRKEIFVRGDFMGL